MTNFDLRVFISSTSLDLLEYRQAAFSAIQSLGGAGDDMVYWSADERTGTEVSVERLRHCDVVVLLLAHRYGFVPPGMEHSVTEAEYLAAKAHGIPILAFILDDSYPWPPERIEWDRIDKLKAFKRQIENEVTRQLYGSPDDLARKITGALVSFTRRKQPTARSRLHLKGLELHALSPLSLSTEVDALIQIGSSEDGLPLLLDVQRSRDISSQLAALVEELGIDDAEVAAMLSSWKQSIESLARSRWLKKGFSKVKLSDGSLHELFVLNANLATMFRSTLSLLLMNGKATHLGDPRPPASQSYKAKRPSATGRRDQGSALALESEGGSNRYMAIDPRSGDCHSVGRLQSEYVQWRAFISESIADNFPRAQVTFENCPHQSILDLPRMLMDAASTKGQVEIGNSTTIVVERAEIANVIAQIADTLGSIHRSGRLHGDLKPDNVLLGVRGPSLIDSFDVEIGDICPGWTPMWSAPEQILGQPVGPASDIFAIGRMIAALLNASLIGEVRKFKAEVANQRMKEFDVFCNPIVKIPKSADSEQVRTETKWASLATRCLRFESSERPASADEVAAELRRLSESFPLVGSLQMELPGRLAVCTLIDGTQAVGRIISCGREPSIGGVGGERYDQDADNRAIATTFSPAFSPDSYFGDETEYSLSQLDAIGDVDPVAEADVYIAYGREKQAEEILLEALRSGGERLTVMLKLLEIYAARCDKKAFETMASRVRPIAQGGEAWGKVCSLGQTIDPENNLYAPTA